MEIYFKYKNKIISTTNLEKKLKRLKIDINDIEIIIPEKSQEIIEENTSYNYYYFYNKNTRETITSIYNNLDNLKENINIEEWNVKNNSRN